MGEGESEFLLQVELLHQAETGNDEEAVSKILASLDVKAAPASWSIPFASNAYCSGVLLAPNPAAFWRRLAKRFPHQQAAVEAVCTALCEEEDLLDLAMPELLKVELGSNMTISLREGSYYSGGVGRHLYAAATALATLLAEQKPLSPSIGKLDVAGRSVLELGCGLGLAGLAAAKCGATSVLLTDGAPASVSCAAANAKLNGWPEEVVRSARLDWDSFVTIEGAAAACKDCGLGDGCWPDVILAADVCYNDTMGNNLISVLSHILEAAPPHARAYIVNGWPNCGLARFETLVGARAALAAAADEALAAGEPPPPSRPFIEEHCETTDSPPRGLQNLHLVACHRLTGFDEHAHHLYIFASSPRQAMWHA